MLKLLTCFVFIFVSTTFSFDDTIHPKIREELMKNPHLYADLTKQDWTTTALYIFIFIVMIGLMLAGLFWFLRPRGEDVVRAPRGEDVVRAPRRRVRRRNSNEEIPLEELRRPGNVNPGIIVEEAE